VLLSECRREERGEKEKEVLSWVFVLGALKVSRRKEMMEGREMGRGQGKFLYSCFEAYVSIGLDLN
jgi:hypothetical protein